MFRIKLGYFLPFLSLFFHEPVVTYSRGYMTYDIAQELGMQRFFHYVLPSGDLQKCKINHSLIFFVLKDTVIFCNLCILTQKRYVNVSIYF